MYEIRKALYHMDTNMVLIMIQFIASVQQYLKRRQGDTGIEQMAIIPYDLGQNGTL